ncbi:MAG: iron-containing alcohol dehydrogenase [Oscillospiraceae bacterium]|nr:iron-containing alcohol dehydrogenase [Candidatus Limimonas egerieequi]
MWTLKKIYWRAIEVVFTALMYCWGWFFPDPTIIDGPGAIKKLPAVVKKKGKNQVLVVTDKGLMGLNLLDGLFKALDEAGVKYVVYDEVQPNPTIENVEAALKLYNDNNCQAVIAVGGGSPMDCAKGTIARVARPERPVAKMSGTFKVFLPAKKMNGLIPPPLYAVPTTAGTGSETTIAAVITDASTHDKFPIMDPFIRARYAVLDPELTAGLPKKVTSTTGMDAMTHAVEGYTNIWYNDKKFNDYGLKAIKLIFENLEKAYNNGSDLEARGNMLLASYYAGLCFTRGGVGYVHGIGHRLGGKYGVPHGLAMSVILPHVFSDALLGPYVYDKLAEIADYVGIIGATDEEKAKKFIAEVEAMNARMEIPTGFDCIKEEDIPWIAEHCIAEVLPTYPVKQIFTQAEIEKFVRDEIMIK